MYHLELILFICGLLICFVFILLMKKYVDRPFGMLAVRYSSVYACVAISASANISLNSIMKKR